MASLDFRFSALVVLILVLADSAFSRNTRNTGGPRNTRNSCPQTNPQQNKQLVLTAYREAFNNRNVNNLETYFHTAYIQHNPLVPDGLDGLKNFVRSLPQGEGIPDIKKAGADGDLVYLHLAMRVFGVDYAIVDIFRVECGKIKEHWDVMQDTKLTTPSANPHPFF